MIQLGTWLAILNAGHARFVIHDMQGFRTIRTLVSHAAGQLTAALVRDGLERSCGSANDACHAISSHSGPHTREKERFAALVAAELNKAAAQCLFARLVLAGPARTLRAVEEALDAAVRRRITGRVRNSLAKVPDQHLAAYFPAWPALLRPTN